MTPERWQIIEKIFHRARELDPEKRANYLAEACEQDDELRQQVEGLLSEGRNLSSVTATPRIESMFAAGTEFGPYRIEGRMGEGGMGVVFRALDTRLGRKVAIKVSSSQFSDRFEREARSIATLNHPHVCTLYDVGPNYLVMELVEGETLMSRLRKGPLPVLDVERYGAQIAGALAEAHSHGIVHRDLKPANVMLTRGSIKVLDFGIAKNVIQADSLTATIGVIGTPAYMAPEQRERRLADPRTDIFALGLLLYEMATGQMPIIRPGEAVTGMPEPLAPIIERCLATDPANRWQSAADVKAMLEWRPTRPVAANSPSQGRRSLLPLIATVLLLVALPLVWYGARRVSSDPSTQSGLHVSITPPPNTSFRFARNGEGGFAISPNGEMLAFIGRTEGKAQLWVRRLSSGNAVPLPNTEGAYQPFWSPDSNWIGFFTPQKLEKISATGGAPIALCDIERPAINGGTWNKDDVILFTVGLEIGRLFRVPGAGGTPVLMPFRGSWPRFLPDGQHFLYDQFSSARDWQLGVGSLVPDEKPRLLETKGKKPDYSAGHLLFVDDGLLYAQPFDSVRAQLSGQPFPVNASLVSRVHLGSLLVDYSANGAGMLVFPPSENALSVLAWRDRKGNLLGTLGGPGEYYSPRIAPDGNRVAFTRRDNQNSDIWIAEPAKNNLTRLTFDMGIDENPIWSPDGTAVIFNNDHTGPANLYRKPSSGAGNAEQLTTTVFEKQANDWSNDGRSLLFTQQTTPSLEITTQSVVGGTPLNFLGNASGAAHAQFSPNARWVICDFDDSGRREIYAQAFIPGQPASSARWQISNSGGAMARWRGDGKELYYLTLDGKMMAVPVSADGAAFQSSTPEFLFATMPPTLRYPPWEYDVSKDGKRFLMIEPAVKPESQTLTLLTNWLTAK